jgi:hypothetical protein
MVFAPWMVFLLTFTLGLAADYYRYRRSVLYPACLSELQFHCAS